MARASNAAHGPETGREPYLARLEALTRGLVEECGALAEQSYAIASELFGDAAELREQEEIPARSGRIGSLLDAVEMALVRVDAARSQLARIQGEIGGKMTVVERDAQRAFLGRGMS